ncbi:trimeric intracellular cation channel family protein [Georgenia sp. Z1344]|uniref:trimeric intracellular cation channel family protein n=1 Tax=Georgenia sp. Z1344 TaxID=3416706 RepID=UPI003CF2D26A
MLTESVLGAAADAGRFQALFDAVDLLGVLANGVLGAAVARALRMDLVAFVTLGIISGLGGGLIRDTLLQVPPVALAEPAYLGTALAGALIGYLVPFDGRWSNRVLVVADALALGCWSAIGTLKAVHLGLAPIPAVLIGLITAVGGGMVRDVLVGRVPAVFGGNTLYAVPAVTGSIVMVVGATIEQEAIAFAVAILVTAGFALLARSRGWQLPGEAPRLALPRVPRRRNRRDDQA